MGIAGLAGSGKALVGDALAGLVRADSGEIWIDGNRAREFRTPSDAIRAGVGYVPQDRYARGIIPLLGVGENLTLPILGQLGRFHWISPRRRESAARRMMASLQIVAASSTQPVGELSGGNQQKVVIGRALASQPRVLVLLHPTAGVDIASKEALFDIVNEARAGGTGVVLVSDDDEELAVCDRVLVIFRGKLVREFDAARDEREVVAAMEGADAK